MEILKKVVNVPVFEFLYQVRVGGELLCARDFYCNGNTEEGNLSLGPRFEARVLEFLPKVAEPSPKAKHFVYRVSEATSFDELTNVLRGSPHIHPAHTAEIIRDQPRSKMFKGVIPPERKRGLFTWHRHESGNAYALFIARPPLNSERWGVSQFELEEMPSFEPGDRIVLPDMLCEREV